MKKVLTLLATIIMFIGTIDSVAVATYAEPVVVINQNNNVKAISPSDLAKYYKAKRRRWLDGTPVKIILPQPGTPEMKALLDAMKLDSEADLNRLYLKLVFQQKLASVPSSLDENSAVEEVRRDRGAIAIVDSNKVKNIQGVRMVPLQ